MAECPTDAELVKFLDEALPAERLAEFSAHVDRCARCQSKLNQFTDTTTRVISRPAASASLTAEVSGEVRVAPSSGNGTEAPEGGTVIIGARPSSPELYGTLPEIPGFSVLAELGRGGMGVVFKARNQRLNRLVALKMILAGPAADPQTVQRFLFEARVLARVQHPQVVQVFEVSTYEGANGVAIPYLAMELLEGGTLGKRLKKGRLDPREAAESIEGIARAVHATHLQGIVHRDLKPGNILFGKEDSHSGDPGATLLLNSSTLPKVCDFGLAKFSDSGGDLTGSGQVVGTPHYMAPEQATGSRQFGPGVDIYALGAILFECLAGRRPFEGDEPMNVLLKVVHEPAPDVRSLRPEVSRDLGAVVAKCLEKDPKRRYHSAEALADDLRRFLENRPTVARPLRPGERVWLWTRRNPALAAAVAVATVALVLGTTASTVFGLWAMEEADRAKRKAEDERDAKIAAVQSEVRAQEARRDAEAAERDATAAGKRAEVARAEAERQRMIANRRQAELEFSRATTSCEEGRVEEGLEGFVRVVELAEANAAADEPAEARSAKVFDRELARVARLNLTAWARELPPKARAFPHAVQPRLAAFLPDGKGMITAARDSQLLLWDTETGERVRTYHAPRPRLVLPGNAPAFWTVAVSPDGKTIAAGAASGEVVLWDVDAPVYRLAFNAVPKEAKEEANIFSLAFAPDGTLWATDGDSGIQQWDLAARPAPRSLGRLAPKTKGPGLVVNILALSPDGTFAYTGDRGGTVREWNLRTRTAGRTWGNTGWVQDVAVSPDGSHLAFTGPPAKVRVIDLKGRKPAFDIDLFGSYGNGVAFAPSRPVLVSSDGDGNVRFWHRDTGQPVGNPLRLPGAVSRMRFRPDSDRFAVPAGNAVYLCDVPEPSRLLTFGRDSRIRGLDFSPGGDSLASADDVFLEVYDARTLKLLQPPDRGQATHRSLRFDPDPTRPRLFRGFRGAFDRLDVPSLANVEARNVGPFGTVHRIDFLRGGAAMFMLGESQVCRYDPRNLELIHAEHPAKDMPAGVQFEAMSVRPDGGEVLVTHGRQVLFLHPETLKPVRRGWAAGEEILDAAYSRDGRHVLVGRRDSAAELLEAEDGRPAVRSMPHARAVAAVAASPNGGLLATGSRDNTARFWDARTGLPVGPPLRHRSEVIRLAFEPNGNRVATGTGAGHVTLWDVPPSGAEGGLDELRSRFERPKR